VEFDEYYGEDVECCEYCLGDDVFIVLVVEFGVFEEVVDFVEE